MSRVIILISILLLGQTTFGQDIIQDQYLKPGLYENFLQFRTNSPSLEGEIEFIQEVRSRIS